MMKDTFTSKWILLDTDKPGVKSIVCVECGFGLGDTEHVTEKDYPKDCPSCKRHMRHDKIHKTPGDGSNYGTYNRKDSI